jgi:hypothetical protein
MYFVLLGAVLELAGVVFLMVRVIQHKPLASPTSPARSDTLEPSPRGGILPSKGNWPGYALIVLGALFLLIGGRI